MKIRKIQAQPRKVYAYKAIRKMKKNLLSMKKKEAMKAGGSNIFFYSGGETFAPFLSGGRGGQGQPSKPQEIRAEIRAEKIEIIGEKGPGGISIQIPKTMGALGSPLSSEEKKYLMTLKISYPLIPKHPKANEKVFAYTTVQWDAAKGMLVYNVVEPSLTAADKDLVEQVKTELEERLDVDFFKTGEIKARELLDREIRDVISSRGGLSREKMQTVQYYVERDIIGLGRIEPLMQDDDIEDVSCDGDGIPLYIYHRNPLYGSIVTNILFQGKDELDTFAMKLSQKCGKSISVAEPLVDGSLPDGSRVQATLGTDIARRGSNFTIRKFTTKPLTPIHMLQQKTMNSTQLAYLWLAIENMKSILVSGGTATGKTSLLNALSLFIKPSLKIVSIEDTPELRLPHPHWVPEVARVPISIGRRSGEVSLFDLLKTSMRQRPDYIIVGEVRGQEAYVLFQQIATGHAGMATIHAASMPQLIDRLTTPPISLPSTLIQNIDIIAFLVRAKRGDRFVRRVNELIEITGVKDDKPMTEVVSRWKPLEDVFETVGKSIIMEHVSKAMGLTEESVMEELNARKHVLEWMLRKNISDYRDVSRVINAYYSSPQKVLDLVERG